MIIRLISIAALAAIVFVGCAKGPESGIDQANMDKTVRAQDDFYRYVNGTWLEKKEIPADKSSYSAFTELYDKSQEDLRLIIEESANAQNNAAGSDEQKVGDFYLSYMDSNMADQLGIQPLREDLDRIAAVKSYQDLTKLTAYLKKTSVQVPFSFWINQDLKKSDQYIGYVSQSGLGLPDRDYYFKKDEKFVDIRNKYVAYIEGIFTLAEIEDGANKAKTIMQMESDLAEKQWTRVENRDRNKTYNKFSIKELNKLTPTFSWTDYAIEADLPADGDLVVRQPSYFKHFNTVLKRYSVDSWKDYYTFKLLSGSAELLNKAFVDLNFDFHGKTLNGIERNRPRWKRAVSGINGVLGEVVGKVYVKKYFKPEAKTRMVNLVENLRKSYAERIKQLDWMSDETKKEALTKLSKFKAKIGYPDEWKNYSALVIEKADLVGNYRRSNLVEYAREVDKLGKPIDRNEWFMTPQTVNAYYNPPMNEVVFPAAILQPPFFNMTADDAVNYGSIGSVIGHELTHGFDDQGRKSDGEGNLRDWWTKDDTEKFDARAKMMVDLYETFVPVDTMRVNGELTLGENIADLGGVTIAYYAYQMSLDGKEANVLDDMTGNQRFFAGWAQVWRTKFRDEALRQRLLTDPHSPGQYRVQGVMANMPEFYNAFDVKESDKVYISEDQRIKIW
ncbi:MAG: M13 family peptidase [Calditrichales bacterium]|nr:MAG: M13 family peptidase [Calditrichales bacterium]